ncbi:MAG: cupin domain-containing protein, partial [Pseudomonadota bacterium]
MDLYRAGERPTNYGPEAYFKGHVTQELINNAPEPARVRAIIVTFAPSARTAWHTHPLGQTLHVLSGVGRFQTWGEKIIEIRP